MGFSAVTNQNNGNGSFFKKGLSAVPTPKNGTNFSDQVGFSVVPKSKNGKFEIDNARSSELPHRNTGKISIFQNCLAAASSPKNGLHFVNQDAKPKIFSFSSD